MSTIKEKQRVCEQRAFDGMKQYKVGTFLYAYGIGDELTSNYCSRHLYAKRERHRAGARIVAKLAKAPGWNKCIGRSYTGREVNGVCRDK